MTSSGSGPRRVFLRAVGMLSMALFVACAALPAAAVAAASPSAAAGDVFYSPEATVDQAKSPEGMRTFLSTDHPQYTLQSYVWAGSLVEDDGRLSTFAFEMQRNPEAIDGTAQLPLVTSAALFNRSSDPGYAVGGSLRGARAHPPALADDTPVERPGPELRAGASCRSSST